MKNKDIQRILAEQRSRAPIYTKTAHEVAMTINNRIKDAATHEKKSLAMLAKYADPEYRAYKAAIQQELAQTDQWQQAHAQGLEQRASNGWHEKNLKAREKVLKPIHTPYGRYPSKRAAVEGMTALGIGNAGGKLSVWLKTKPSEFYYIDK